MSHGIRAFLYAATGTVLGAGGAFFAFDGMLAVALGAFYGLVLFSLMSRAFDPGTFVGGKLEAQWGVVILGILGAVGIPAYQDYKVRETVAKGVADGIALGAQMNVFYDKQKRLPSAAEAPKSQPAGTAWAVAYDPAGRMIVVTLGEGSVKGRRVAVRAETAGPTLRWTCRTIDLDKRYLPKSCRSE